MGTGFIGLAAGIDISWCITQHHYEGLVIYFMKYVFYGPACGARHLP